MNNNAEPRTRRAVCTVCDAACQLRVTVHNGEVTRIGPSDNPLLADNICIKGATAAALYARPERLKQPLKRIGAHGEGRWQTISWEQAIDEIAGQLKTLVAAHGPETLAVSTSNWNTSVEHGMGRRFLNLLGSPNWISGVAMCMGNTAAVNKAAYSRFPWPEFFETECIVLFGHNPREHSWTPVYNLILQAQARGAKLIVLDPRRSSQAERADLHLPLRSGTDAAMLLGWLNLIIEERLYGAAFVGDWTVGFDALAERARQYPLERVAGITGVAPELIAQAARLYATAASAVMPWSPTLDQQVSSTSAIRLQSILRAICGHFDVPGGELLYGFNPAYRSESALELHQALSPEQRRKQLGAEQHPLTTHRAAELLEPHLLRVHGQAHANLVMGSYMAHPGAVFQAMETGRPYPVKALFTLGNNTLLAYPNQQRTERALRKAELLVCHELFMTPTANLCDHVLPGDSWLERENLHDSFGWRSWLLTSERCVAPPPECRGVFDFWRDLAVAMGLGEHFPWRSVREVMGHRLEPMGIGFDEFAERYDVHIAAKPYRSYRERGFATPSGKVQLHASVLAQLGLDPLPYWREAPRPTGYGFNVFIGVREDPYFQTGQRQLPALRKLSPTPQVFVCPQDAGPLGLASGDWARVSAPHGSVCLQVALREDMPPGHLRVPHGWWLPELLPAHAAGAADQHNDGMLIDDAPEHLDAEQGVPHFKGFAGRIERLQGPPPHWPAHESTLEAA